MKTFLKIFAFVLFAQVIGYYSLAVCNCGVQSAPLNATCATCIAAGAGCSWDNSRTCPADAGTGSTASANSVQLTNPLGNVTSVPALIGTIINVALGVVGSLALVMFIYGGFTWMLAAGNESAVEKGKNILMWATIGLVVIFASYSLVSFVINSLTNVPK